MSNLSATHRPLTTIILGIGLTASLLASTPSNESSLKQVLQRSAAYATDYHQRFTALVAEERYVQRTGPLRPATPGGELPKARQERSLRSDYVMLRDFAGSNSWLGVREVFEVDGESVTVDRERLQALLEDTSRPLESRLRALADMQAKYNLGEVYRTINVPTLPLEFLLPDRQPRFHFKHAGNTTFHDRPLWIVSFSERNRPTIIRTPEGHDIQSSGSFWINPETGAVLRSELRTGEIPGRPLRTIILVSYSLNTRFDMLLPDDMNELYLTGRTRIEGHATYSKYRRWEAEATIKLPDLAGPGYEQAASVLGSEFAGTLVRDRWARYSPPTPLHYTDPLNRDVPFPFALFFGQPTMSCRFEKCSSGAVAGN